MQLASRVTPERSLMVSLHSGPELGELVYLAVVNADGRRSKVGANINVDAAELRKALEPERKAGAKLDGIPAPEARVRHFVELSTNDYIAYEGMGGNYRSLTTTDLKDTLAELAEIRDRLEQLAPLARNLHILAHEEGGSYLQELADEIFELAGPVPD